MWTIKDTMVIRQTNLAVTSLRETAGYRARYSGAFFKHNYLLLVLICIPSVRPFCILLAMLGCCRAFVSTTMLVDPSLWEQEGHFLAISSFSYSFGHSSSWKRGNSLSDWPPIGRFLPFCFNSAQSYVPVSLLATTANASTVLLAQHHFHVGFLVSYHWIAASPHLQAMQSCDSFIHQRLVTVVEELYSFGPNLIGRRRLCSPTNPQYLSTRIATAGCSQWREVWCCSCLSNWFLGTSMHIFLDGFNNQPALQHFRFMGDIHLMLVFPILRCLLLTLHWLLPCFRRLPILHSCCRTVPSAPFMESYKGEIHFHFVQPLWLLLSLLLLFFRQDCAFLNMSS